MKYKGGIDAFRTIFREEGIRGLYQGLLPAILLTSHGAVQFATYEYMKDVLLATKKLQLLQYGSKSMFWTARSSH